MRQSPHRARSLVALIVIGSVLASCGGGTAAPAPSAAPATVAAATVAPAPTVAAVTAPPAAKTLFIIGDTVRGTKNLTDEEKTFLGCVQQNRFAPDQQIVWRFRVMDPVTAKALDDKQLKSFAVTLPDGKALPMKYGEHPKASGIWFWTSSFVVPKDSPTGAFNYKAVATDQEGRTGAFEQFNVANAMLQIIPAGKR